MDGTNAYRESGNIHPLSVTHSLLLFRFNCPPTHYSVNLNRQSIVLREDEPRWATLISHMIRAATSDKIPVGGLYNLSIVIEIQHNDLVIHYVNKAGNIELIRHNNNYQHEYGVIENLKMACWSIIKSFFNHHQ